MFTGAKLPDSAETTTVQQNPASCNLRNLPYEVSGQNTSPQWDDNIIGPKSTQIVMTWLCTCQKEHFYIKVLELLNNNNNKKRKEKLQYRPLSSEPDHQTSAN